MEGGEGGSVVKAIYATERAYSTSRLTHSTPPRSRNRSEWEHVEQVFVVCERLEHITVLKSRT